MLSFTLNAKNLLVSGSLTRSEINQNRLDKAKKLLGKGAQQVDLDDVNQVDTSGLAFLLVLLEHAKQNNNQLTFTNLPEDLLHLAQLSAVDDFLSIA